MDEFSWFTDPVQWQKFLDADLSRTKRLARQSRINQIERSLRPRCGNCDHWMKSSLCPHEKNVNGYSRGPSCDEMPCGKFTESTWSLKGLRDELSNLRKLQEENR